MIYYDNGGDGEKAIANADDAVGRKIDLLIEYNDDIDANVEIGRRMQAAGIPVLALNYPVPGAPLYTADNLAAGRIAGKTLGEFARENWADQTVVAVIAGDLGNPAPYLADRVRGITEALRQELPDVAVTRLDTSGNPVRAGRSARQIPGGHRPGARSWLLLLDDPTALAAKAAVERAGRIGDCVIVSQGVDHSIHGGASEKKELDPSNRGSIVLGSVAYYVDRYGYEVLPLAMKMLQGARGAGRTTTKHILISARNVFTEYPPYDMN